MRPLLLVLLLALGISATAAELTARLDRDQITDAESVALSLILSGDVRGTPDIAPLAADFDLLDQSHTTRMDLVDGQARGTQEWRLQLAPRRTGILTVPALRVGDLMTEPLTLEVAEAAMLAAEDQELAGQDVQVEVSATPEAPYVQGHVDYRVRLLSRVPLYESHLSDPAAEGVVALQLGEDRQAEETIGGERYTVRERRYAIFPQRSGALTIVPPLLNAVVPVERAVTAAVPAPGFGSDPFAPIGDDSGAKPGGDGLFEATRQVRARGRAISLDVRPQPVGAPVPWLPATSVELTDDWSPATAEIQVDEAVTRTIRVTAAGITSAQLPDIELTAPAGIELRPAPPRTEDLVRGEIPVAIKQLEVALVPVAVGQVRVPEIRLAWWDTATDQPRETLLPARILDVRPPHRLADRASDRTLTVARDVEGGKSSAGQGPFGRAWAALALAGLWPFLTASMGVGWFVTAGLWWLDRRRRRVGTAVLVHPVAMAGRPQVSLADARMAVERACRHRGPGDVRDALLAWAALIWPDDPPRGLAGLAVRFESNEAAAIVTALDRRLYAREPTTWDGPASWTVLEPALKASGRRSD